MNHPLALDRNNPKIFWPWVKALMMHEKTHEKHTHYSSLKGWGNCGFNTLRLMIRK